MAANGKQAVKFYGLAAKEGNKIIKRYNALDIAKLSKDCENDTEKVLTVAGELLCDDKAAESIVKIVAGYSGIEESQVTPPVVMNTVLGIVTDDEMGDSVGTFLAFAKKMQASSDFASGNITVLTASSAS